MNLRGNGTILEVESRRRIPGKHIGTCHPDLCWNSVGIVRAEPFNIEILTRCIILLLKTWVPRC